MLVRFKLIFYWRSFMVLLAAFFALPQFSQEPATEPVLVAPFTQTVPRTLFDEPVYQHTPISGSPLLAVSQIPGCVLNGPRWDDRLPEDQGACYPSSCGNQSLCTMPATNKRCQEGHLDTQPPCDVCPCALQLIVLAATANTQVWRNPMT